MNAVHNLPSHTPCTLGFPSAFFLQHFKRKSVCLYLLSKACYMTGSSHAPWCDNRNNIWWGAQFKKLRIL
jgi:hypothetical protein